MGMDTKIITGKVQEFNGVRFYKGGRYYRHVVNRHHSLSLHRVVWEFHHGPIPATHHVHHLDFDTSNNQIANLAIMPRGHHFTLHWTPERCEWASRNVVKKAMPAAKVWHKSKKGRRWHAMHAKLMMVERLRPRVFTCQECGIEFTKGCIQTAKYCGDRCRWRAAGREKRKRARLLAMDVVKGLVATNPTARIGRIEVL